MTVRNLCRVRMCVLAVAAVAVPALADSWMEAGPYVIQNGQIEGLGTQKNPVIGAVKSILPLTTDEVLLTTVNGGIWKTSNFSNANPTWTNVTSNAPTLSLGALEPALNDNSFLLAGYGAHSSFQQGGPLKGLVKSTNMGATWTPINNATLNGVSITAVLPRGPSVMLVTGRNSTFGTQVSTKHGLYRTQDGGTTFAALANNGTSNLPEGEYTDLCFAPGNLSASYVAVCQTSDPDKAGIYRTESTGIDPWVQVYTAPANTINIRLAGRTNTFSGPDSVYAAVVTGSADNNAALNRVIRTKNNGGTWTSMDLPDSDGFGLHTSTGQLHMAILADPTNDNIVYIGGQSQDASLDGAGDRTIWPNQLGASDYSGRLFRGTFNTATAATVWDSLTHTGGTGTGQTPNGGTANNSAPHADTRDLRFVGDKLVVADDGGIYIRNDPRANTGDWTSKIGTGLQITEAYTVAIDPVSGVIMAANQDTGTMQQTQKGSKTYTEIPRDMAGTSFITGDGGRAVASKLGGGQSVRYAAFSGMFGLQRAVYDGNGVAVSIDACDNKGPGGKPLNEEAGFLAPLPFDVNKVDNERLACGSITDQVDDGMGGMVTRNGTLFVSSNKGKTWSNVGGVAAGESVFSIVYGGAIGGIGNIHLIFAGTNGQKIYRRTAIGVNVDPLTDYGGSTPVDLALDPNNWNKIFAVDNAKVWGASNADAADPADVDFTDYTGNLPAGFNPQAVVYVPNGDVSLWVVGGFGGVYSTNGLHPGTWSLLATDLPNVQVKDLAYDPETHIVAVATLGRGIFTVEVPEPGSISMIGVGSLVCLRRRRGPTMRT